ncbi:zf-UBP-domain-containing protein [Sistotremastrum suecicum HHB10207 ss-3]|uniref:Zf-UBP-domain-containing protein n=1 Tax=Sistotremastrum suecicum HHB10207 ss-3 TaxID=1314776 RepID=A0A166HTY5_9AGAM|nr:zf-UBP-domain-containing protein [Sistotremastrum suecicum HHB10207 ss-3]
MSTPRFHFVIRHSALPTPEGKRKYIPSSIFDSLPSNIPTSYRKRTTLSSSAAPKVEHDWRHGSIRVDWIDFSTSMNKDMSAEASSSSAGKGDGPPIATYVPSGGQTPLTKEGSAELAEGVVHIYRERPRTSDSSGASSSTPKTIDDGTTAGGTCLAVLAVPPYMTPSDFLTFVAPAAESMVHLRMIRDSSPNRSIVLIKFGDPEDAEDFAQAYNGRQFNSMEPEICLVVRVASVTVEECDEATLATSRLSYPQDTRYELPTCPVCLERMDSAVTGLVTVPCSHTFHCTCLTKWGDSRCPVCRYSQNLLTSHPTNTSRTIPFANPGSPTLSTCWDCSSTTNLWICLICGNVGCGRYGQAHAQGHYQRTTHLYALELETQRVWDYAGDGYVHRLIQNKADGKLVELPSASSMASNGLVDSGAASRGLGPGPADTLAAEKIEAIGIEYSYLLTSQLDSQRAYFEDEKVQLVTQLEETRRTMANMSLELDNRIAALRQEEQDRVQMLEKEKIKAEKRAEKMAELARKLDKELKEERAVSQGLMHNLGKLKDRAEEADKEKVEQSAKITELQDQMRDLMFYLEAREKIEQGEGGASEAAGGTVELPQQGGKTGKKTRTKR